MTFDAWWQHWLELNRSNIRPGPECECSEKVSARAAWQRAQKEKDDELSRLKAAVRQVIDNVDFDKREVHSFAALRVLQNSIGYLRDKNTITYRKL